MSDCLPPEHEEQIRKRVTAASPGPWDVDAHQHAAAGCRCLSCYDPVVGWLVEPPGALDCEDLVASKTGQGITNDTGRSLGYCNEGPLLSYEDAKFAACAREDIPALLAEIDRLRKELEEK